MRRVGLFSLVLLLSACNFFAPDTAVQLLEEENQGYSTQISAIRASATAFGDHLLATQQLAGTAVRAVDQQSTRIASTLIARGTPFVDTSRLLPMTPTPLPIDAVFTGAPGAGSAPNNPQLITPILTNEGAARGSVLVAATPAFTALPQSQPTPLPPVEAAAALPALGSAASLNNIQVSTSVGADDCAVNPTPRFSDAAASIYVSATAANLSAANLVTSRWLYAGAQQVSYDWTPPGTVNGACIWFYITPEATAFTPGAWSVELLIDGAVVGTASFTIEGMDDMG